MNLTQDKINLVIDHVTTALSKLDKGNELTEEECLLVISDLENLKLAEREEDKNIDELLNEFNLGADNADRFLRGISEIISSGRVPGQEDVKSLNVSIDELRRKYNSIYLSALAQVSEDEMPKEGCPAAEYVEAVKNSAAAMSKRRLKEIVQMLEKFLSVRSLDEKYDLALAPHREKAEKLIAGISSHSAPKIDELEREIFEYKVFLDMLMCDAPDSDDAMTLMESVAEYYCRRIQHGLDVGKYIFSEPHDTHDATGSDEEAEVCENDGGSLGISEFAKKIEESGILLDCNTNLGIFSKGISSNEDKKATASIFQNDIRNGYTKALKTIVYETVRKGSLFVRYMTIMHGMPEDVAISSAEYLQHKGYLRKYTLSPHGEIYCASPRLEKSLTYRDAARIVNITSKALAERHRQTEHIKESSASVGCRILYWNLYCDSLQRFINMGYSSFTEETNISAECFFTKVYAPKMDNISCELIIGALWDNTDKCDDFLESLKKALGDKKPIKSVIFAANTQAGAMVLAKILLNEEGESINSEHIYLYSLNDEKYYDYFDGCEVDTADIGLKRELEEKTNDANSPVIRNASELVL